MANATAVDKADKSVANRVHEKRAEKRRALGRGLESLLPGPRAVTGPAPTLPQSARKDGAPDGESSQFSVPGSQQPCSPQIGSQGPGTGAPTAAEAIPGTIDSLQAAAAGRTSDAEVLLLGLDQIEQNPYQTRTEFEEKALSDLAGSIQAQGVLQPIVVRPSGNWPAGTGHPDGRERFILVLG